MNTPTVSEWEYHLTEGGGVDNISDIASLLSMRQNRFLAPLIKPGCEIVDAGSGNGRYVLAFAMAGAKVVGVDFSERLTAVVQERARRLQLDNATAIKADMLALPFPDNHFDLYTSFGVYEHFSGPQHAALFAEALRVLKPGGRIYLEVPQFWSAWTVRRQFRYWYRKLRPPSLVWQHNMRREYVVRYAETAGFRTVEAQVFDAWQAFEKGFSLSQGKISFLPNPFYILRASFKRASEWCDRRQWLGHTLVYIGMKD